MLEDVEGSGSSFSPRLAVNYLFNPPAQPARGLFRRQCGHRACTKKRRRLALPGPPPDTGALWAERSLLLRQRPRPRRPGQGNTRSREIGSARFFPRDRAGRGCTPVPRGNHRTDQAIRSASSTSVRTTAIASASPARKASSTGAWAYATAACAPPTPISTTTPPVRYDWRLTRPPRRLGRLDARLGPRLVQRPLLLMATTRSMDIVSNASTCAWPSAFPWAKTALEPGRRAQRLDDEPLTFPTPLRQPPPAHFSAGDASRCVACAPSAGLSRRCSRSSSAVSACRRGRATGPGQRQPGGRGERLSRCPGAATAAGPG